MFHFSIIKEKERKNLKDTKYNNKGKQIYMLPYFKIMSGFVYLLCDGERFKIGMTRGTIEKRISELQTGNPNEIFISAYHKTEHPMKVEQMMHLRYKISKVKNEWFNLSIDQVVSFNKECDKCEQLIESLKTNPFFNF